MLLSPEQLKDLNPQKIRAVERYLNRRGSVLSPEFLESMGKKKNQSLREEDLGLREAAHKMALTLYKSEMFQLGVDPLTIADGAKTLHNSLEKQEKTPEEEESEELKKKGKDQVKSQAVRSMEAVAGLGRSVLDRMNENVLEQNVTKTITQSV